MVQTNSQFLGNGKLIMKHMVKAVKKDWITNVFVTVVHCISIGITDLGKGASLNL